MGHYRHAVPFCGLLITVAQAGLAHAQTADSSEPALSRAAANSSRKDATDSSGDIIVTANKRSERELDVAGAIKAFSGDQLLQGGNVSLKDYAGFVPGLQINTNRGSEVPVIRGITTSADNGTLVGVVVNGAQIGSSSSLAQGSLDTLDLDPIDLARIEVLKGPQGTTYGANTLSGLLSYTLRDPDLDHITATVRGEIFGTDGGGTSNSLRGALSVPLIAGVAGIRLSGFQAHDAGFIDNDVRNIDNQNKNNRWGVSGSFLVEPAAGLRITVAGFYQHTNALEDDVIYNAAGNPRDGDLKYNDYLHPSHKKTIRALITTVDYSLGGATLSSITGYQHTDGSFGSNATYSVLGQLLPVLSNFGGVALPSPHAATLNSATSLHKITEELRLASSGAGPLQWMVGGLYQHERTRNLQDLVATDTAGNPLMNADPALRFDLEPTYTEYAAFANVTYFFSPRFDVTGGIRYSRIDQSFGQSFSGSDAAAFNLLSVASGVETTPYVSPIGKSAQSVANYLATARYHFSENGMIFARFATGYRPGGTNLAALGLPPSFDPDRTNNYEIGVKSKFLDGKVIVDLTGYYTKWKNIITFVGTGGITGLGNAGDAEIYGTEGSLTLRPVPSLSIIGTLAYSHAKFLDTTSVAQKGDSLPYNPRFSGSVSAEYRIPVDARWTGILNASGRFSGSRDSFPAHFIAPDYILRGYALVDLRVGIESSRLDLSLFVKNLTNKRAQLSAFTYYGINEVTVARPFSVGATVTVRY